MRRVSTTSSIVALAVAVCAGFCVTWVQPKPELTAPDFVSWIPRSSPTSDPGIAVISQQTDRGVAGLSILGKLPVVQAGLVRMFPTVWTPSEAGGHLAVSFPESDTGYLLGASTAFRRLSLTHLKNDGVWKRDDACTFDGPLPDPSKIRVVGLSVVAPITDGENYRLWLAFHQIDEVKVVYAESQNGIDWQMKIGQGWGRFQTEPMKSICVARLGRKIQAWFVGRQDDPHGLYTVPISDHSGEPIGEPQPCSWQAPDIRFGNINRSGYSLQRVSVAQSQGISHGLKLAYVAGIEGKTEIGMAESPGGLEKTIGSETTLFLRRPDIRVRVSSVVPTRKPETRLFGMISTVVVLALMLSGYVPRTTGATGLLIGSIIGASTIPPDWLPPLMKAFIVAYIAIVLRSSELQLKGRKFVLALILLLALKSERVWQRMDTPNTVFISAVAKNYQESLSVSLILVTVVSATAMKTARRYAGINGPMETIIAQNEMI